MSKKKHDENNPSLSMIYKKIAELEVHVAENHTDIKWLKDIYKSLSNRQWALVTGVIIVILLQILFFVAGK